MAKQIALVLVAFVAIVAIFVFVERAFSPTFQKCIATDSYVRCSAVLVKNYEASITALATIIIAAFTGTLWIATSHQAELTRRTLIADKRAFVFAAGIVGIYELDPLTGHYNWRVAPVWHNSGDTPTRQLRIYTDAWFGNTPLPANFDFTNIDPLQGPGGGMLGPKMSNNGGQAPHIPHQAALAPQDIVDIQNGRRFFFLWGWARYFSTLPDTPEHITRFCWRVFFTGDPFVFNPAVNPSSVTVHNLHLPQGNCADEECRLQGLG